MPQIFAFALSLLFFLLSSLSLVNSNTQAKKRKKNWIVPFLFSFIFD
jgi:Sec-independent protein secretion pathway component TatC